MYVLGIHADGEVIKGAVLSSSANKITIHSLEECQDIPEELEGFKKNSLKKRGEIASALLPDEVFVRKISLPLKRRSALMKALPFQMEELLPFDREYGTAFPHIERNKHGSDVTFYSFLNDSLENHIEKMQGLGFDPDWVFSVPNALAHFAKRFGGGEDKEIVFYLGFEKTYLIYLEKGEVQKYYTLSMGVQTFQEALHKKNREVNVSETGFLQREIERHQGEETRMGVLIATLRKEVFRVLESIKRQKEIKEPVPILFTGYADLAKLLITEAEDFPLKPIQSLPHLEYSTTIIASFAIEIGLGLEALETKKQKVQFRQGAFVAKRQLTKAKKKLQFFLGYALSTCFLTLTTLTIFFAKTGDISKRRFYEIAESQNVNLGGLIPVKSKFSLAVESLIKKIGVQKQEESFSTPPLLYPYFTGLPLSVIKTFLFDATGETAHITLEFPRKIESEIKEIMERMGGEVLSNTSQGNDVYQAVYIFKATP